MGHWVDYSEGYWLSSDAQLALVKGYSGPAHVKANWFQVT